MKRKRTSMEEGSTNTSKNAINNSKIVEISLDECKSQTEVLCDIIRCQLDSIKKIAVANEDRDMFALIAKKCRFRLVYTNPDDMIFKWRPGLKNNSTVYEVMGANIHRFEFYEFHLNSILGRATLSNENIVSKLDEERQILEDSHEIFKKLDRKNLGNIRKSLGVYFELFVNNKSGINTSGELYTDSVTDMMVHIFVMLYDFKMS